MRTSFFLSLGSEHVLLGAFGHQESKTLGVLVGIFSGDISRSLSVQMGGNMGIRYACMSTSQH